MAEAESVGRRPHDGQGSRTTTLRTEPAGKELEIDKLFRALVKLEGSDLHLKVGLPPHVRVDGALRPLNRGPLDDEECIRLLFELIDTSRD